MSPPHSSIDQWIGIVTTRFPVLSKPQATVLALWSFGMMMTQKCGQTTVACFLAEVLGKKEDAVRQRLREWTWEKESKRGLKRSELDVTICFSWLLRWILQEWSPTERRMALALDATSLADRFVVLAISVVYRGSGIPIAWVVLPATQSTPWKPHWLALLRQVEAVLPADWLVIVLADRGLYARWLYRAIVAMGWHPFLRINPRGLYQPLQGGPFHSLANLLPQPGHTWSGRVICFKTRPLKCTLLACWREDQESPWLILTDLTPRQADIAWYALRAWIEAQFKDTKRGGWQWQYTRMLDPQRISRFWLALAVTLLWAMSVGGEADASLPPSNLQALPPSHIARRMAKGNPQPRGLSCCRQGWIAILAALITGKPLPVGNLHNPEPWPSITETYP